MAKTSRITEPNTFDFEYSLFLPMIRKYDCSAWYKKLVSTPTDKIIKKYLESFRFDGKKKDPPINSKIIGKVQMVPFANAYLSSWNLALIDGKSGPNRSNDQLDPSPAKTETMPVTEIANAISPYSFTVKSLTTTIDRMIPEIFMRKVDS